MRVFTICLLSLVLLAGACSDDTASGERVVPTPEAGAELEAQEIDGFAPGIDDRVAIVGIAAGQTLSVHALPGANQPIIAEIPSTATDLFGYGETSETPDGRQWWLIRYEDAQGWIEPGAAYLGGPVDISVGIAGRLSNTTYDDPNTLLAEVRSLLGGELVTVFQGPAIDGPATTILDELTDGDDSVRGRRITLTLIGEGGSFRLSEVQEQALCARGVDDSGLCV